MAFSAGTRLGPYEIIGPIGAGGMGEVYKARDTRLERIVAIKTLPPDLAHDPEFTARFDREARNISALNHPHICTLFDVGDDPAGAYLVLEYLEGETLAARLKKGPLPIDDVLELAGQIASALDKAHRQGIVHRDLKPANIFLVKSSGAAGLLHCKLLDFGLAKTGGVATPGTAETRRQASPDAPLTSKGSVLGTFQYMAPEQIEGHVDARSDIWAFGCVVYEMLTGKRAFEGGSQASLIASILQGEPVAMGQLRPTPPVLERLVRTCLEKDPDNRFHTAHDLWLHVRSIKEVPPAGLKPPVGDRTHRGRILTAAIALALAGVAAAAAWRLKPSPTIKNVVSRFSYPLPDGQTFTAWNWRNIAISPDGTKLAYIANDQIYLRPLGDLTAHPIPGTHVSPHDLAFSPDSQSIVFFDPVGADAQDGGSLRKVSIASGATERLCPVDRPSDTSGIYWQGDRIIFSLGNRIMSVADTGGAPSVLLKAGADVTENFAQAQLVGGGEALLYTVDTSYPSKSTQIAVQPFGGARRVLIEDGTDGRVLPSGHLVWMRDQTLFAQAIDLKSLQLSGEPVALIEGIGRAAVSGAGRVSISDDGTLIFAETNRDRADLVWVHRDGREEPIGAPARNYFYPSLSPDDSKLVAAAAEDGMNVWVWDLSRKVPTKLTSKSIPGSFPIWSHDGQTVIFRSGNTNAQTDLYRRPADGSGTLDPLTKTPEAETPLMSLADGRLLIRVTRTNTEADGKLFVMPLDPNGRLQPVFRTLETLQANASVSPDGQWIAYQSNENGTGDEIHVRPFPDTGTRHWQISFGGGRYPLWSRTGTKQELFYVNQVSKTFHLMRVEVKPPSPDGGFVSSVPALLLDLSKYAVASIGRPYDVSLDGQKFVVIKRIDGGNTERPSVTVVTHWFDELRARVKK